MLETDTTGSCWFGLGLVCAKMGGGDECPGVPNINETRYLLCTLIAYFIGSGLGKHILLPPNLFPLPDPFGSLVYIA